MYSFFFNDILFYIPVSLLRAPVAPFGFFFFWDTALDFSTIYVYFTDKTWWYIDDVAKIVMAGFNILLIIILSCAELTGMNTVIGDLKATVSTLY